MELFTLLQGGAPRQISDVNQSICHCGTFSSKSIPSYIARVPFSQNFRNFRRKWNTRVSSVPLKNFKTKKQKSLKRWARFPVWNFVFHLHVSKKSYLKSHFVYSTNRKFSHFLRLIVFKYIHLFSQ